MIPSYRSRKGKTSAHSSCAGFVQPTQSNLMRLPRKNYSIEEQLVFVRKIRRESQRIITADANRHGRNLVV